MKTQNRDEDDGLPHVFAVDTGPGSTLPPGLISCRCCGRNVTHRDVRAFDADLIGYLCHRCFGPMACAEYYLRLSGLRMPSGMEAMELEDKG